MYYFNLGDNCDLVCEMYIRLLYNRYMGNITEYIIMAYEYEPYIDLKLTDYENKICNFFLENVKKFVINKNNNLFSCYNNILYIMMYNRSKYRIEIFKNLCYDLYKKTKDHKESEMYIHFIKLIDDIVLKKNI